MNHPSIVQFEEYHETKKSVYLIYEYLEGPPLIKKILPDILNIDNVRIIMLALLKGIKHIKDHNIVHRDIKPFNLIFKDSVDISTLKIIDFGLSCYMFESSQPFKICGTPGFIAPEIFKVERFRGWTTLNSSLDIYSLGVIFHYLLFGKFLFEGEGDADEIYLKNKKGLFEMGVFDDLEENLKSDEAYDLMRRMLIPVQKERITVEEALGHPFFNEKFGEKKEEINEKSVKVIGEDFNLDIPDDPENNLCMMMKMNQMVCKDHQKLFSSRRKNNLKFEFFEDNQEDVGLKNSSELSTSPNLRNSKLR